MFVKPILILNSYSIWNKTLEIPLSKKDEYEKAFNVVFNPCTNTSKLWRK